MLKKRVFLLAIIFIMMLQSAFAVETEFCIRDEIKWGMSIEEVIKIEAERYFDDYKALPLKEEGLGNEEIDMRKKEFVAEVKEGRVFPFGDGATILNPNSEGELRLLTVETAKVSKFDASLIFAFFEEELVACLYGFWGNGYDSEYLQSALETKYGAFEDDCNGELNNAVESIYSMSMRKMWGKIFGDKHIRLDDGTVIHSFFIELGSFCILYQNTNIQWTEIAKDVFDDYGL